MKTKEEYIMESESIAERFVLVWFALTPIDERVYNPEGDGNNFEMIQDLKESEPRYFKYLINQFSVLS